MGRKTPAPASPPEASRRMIRYTLAHGWQVLVGRTDIDNDELTFRVARPEDWWFHVRGMPGSHVILQGVWCKKSADAT
jgi:predicted ribosome quality control (RQC) complex YloA/Tae2 family protein